MAPDSTPAPVPASVARVPWLNRSSLGVSLASLFSDVSHELATAVLPSVIVGLGAGAGALGVIEGLADGLSAIAKLWGGVQADRVSRHKPLAAIGYLGTALATAGIGVCTRAWQILLCRATAWIARGSRSASRDLLLVGAVPDHARGRAFGMERAGDAFGATLGPLLALLLIHFGTPAKEVMLWSVAPGVAAFLSIALVVRERPTGPPAQPRTLRASLSGTGTPFRRYLVAVLAFGSGDFSRTLLILFATQHLPQQPGLLAPAALAIWLYVLHNAVSAAAALPLGTLSDRLGARPVLLGGYLLAAATTAGFGLLPPSPWILAGLFVSSGVAVACGEVAEKATAVPLLPASVKGTGLGMLAAVNGIGDVISSATVGALWSWFPEKPAVGLLAAASLQVLGAFMLGSARAGVDGSTPVHTS